MSSKNKYLIPLAVFAALFGTLWCRALDVPTYPTVKGSPIVLEKRNEMRKTKSQILSTEKSANNWMPKLPKSIWSPSAWIPAFPDLMAMISAGIKTRQRPEHRDSNCTATDPNNCDQKSMQPDKLAPEASSDGLHKSKRVIYKFVRIGRVPRQLENVHNATKTLKTTEGSEMKQLSEEKPDQTPDKLQPASTGNKRQQGSKTVDKVKSDTGDHSSRSKWVDYIRKRVGNARIGKLPAALFVRTWGRKRTQTSSSREMLRHQLSMITKDPRKVTMDSLPRYG